jgi:hypothetical protein
MAADPEDDATTPTAVEPSTPQKQQQRSRAATEASVRTEGTSNTEDEEDEEPRLKYSRLTGNLASCYRSDSTSSFLVAGDKMVG